MKPNAHRSFSSAAAAGSDAHVLPHAEENKSRSAEHGALLAAPEHASYLEGMSARRAFTRRDAASV